MKKIINKNDWFIAGVIKRCEPISNNKKNPRRRGTTWVNHVLIHAISPKEAYDKATKHGQLSTRRYKTVRGDTIQWKFLGLAELLPVYDDIEDGTELLWADHGEVQAKTAQRLVKSKQELIKQATRK